MKQSSAISRRDFIRASAAAAIALQFAAKSAMRVRAAETAGPINLGLRRELFVDDFLIARNSLIEKSLIAFDGFMFQVLSLPEKPPPPAKALTSRQDFENNDPFTIHQIITNSIGR